MGSHPQPNLTLKYGSGEYYAAIKDISILKPLVQNKSQELPLLNISQDDIDCEKFISRRSPSPNLNIVPSTLTDKENDSKTLYCSFCEELFANVAQQRKHYKQDWHRYNIKLKLASRPPISEEKFDNLADDVSSISGSDNEDEDDVETLGFQLHRQARILFENKKGQVISIFRCLLYDKKENQPSDEEIISLAQKREIDPYWMILMLSGGHFAAAIYKGNEPLMHKTFHCYTVRAKQGGAQSTKDNKGNHPKSAGASLRRYNETALVQHVQELLSAWSSEIAKCSLILYRAVGPTNRNVLFGGKEPPMNKGDPRLRHIPFPTRRPTFSQLQFVYNMLTSVHIYSSVSVLTTVVEPKPTRRDLVSIKKSHICRSKSRPSPDRQLPDHVHQLANLETPSGSEAEIYNLVQEVQEISFNDELKEFDSSFENERAKKKVKRKKKKSSSSDEPKHMIVLSKQLLNAVDTPNTGVLEPILEDAREQCTEEEFVQLMNKTYDSSKNTLLHIAAKHAQKDNIRLLMSVQASPCNKDFMSRTAYDLAPDRESRNVFRRYMAEFPDQYDYTKSHIPSPLTDEKEQEMADRKRILKKVKREKDKEKKKEKEVIKKEQVEKDRFLQLSDREKMALAAEKRIQALQQANTNSVKIVLSRCFQCAADITGKVPFIYNENRFCTIDCLKVHRKSHPTPEI